MTTVQKNITQRLFGRTVIDSLDLNQNAWYIDEVQVTATADELNAAGDGITTINAYNGTGGAFTVGMLLHVSSFNTASGYLIVEKADADNSKPAQYLAVDTTASTGTTIIQDYYDAVTFNTVGATVGDPVYLSVTAGAFSLSAPTGADDMVQIVGRVKTVGAAGTVIIDLRKTERVKIGTNEYVDASITDAKLADDVATGLAGTASTSALTATSGVLKVDIHSVAADTPASGDLLIFSDEGSAGDPNKTVTVDNYGTFLAGVAATTGLGSTSGYLVVAPADVAPTLATDYIHTATAANVPGKVLMSGYATALAGTETTTGLSATSGVLAASLGYTAATVDVGNDDIIFRDHSDTHLPKTDSIASLVSGMAGSYMTSSGGTISNSNFGAQGEVALTFTGAGDLTTLSIKGINFPITATGGGHPDVTAGEWATDGGGVPSKAASIASLVAGINGDTRNAGVSYFTAIVSGDNVLVFDKVSAAGFTVSMSVGTTDPVATTLNTGVAPVLTRTYMATKVVSVFEDALAGFDIPVPFSPSKFVAFCTTAAGVPKVPTDQITIQTLPNRIHVTAAGATQLVATDIITIIAME